MLHIVIVGAGIAGLSAALSLRRAGHRVDVYERHGDGKEKEEYASGSEAAAGAAEAAGAAITMPPNASRILVNVWGVKPSDWGFVACEATDVRDGATLETLAVFPADYKAAKMAGEEGGGGGEDVGYYFAHRGDLHACLRWLAMREDGRKSGLGGPPVRIHGSSEVVAYDPSAPSITLRDGRTIRADVVVGADGVHSGAAREVVGSAEEAEASPPRGDSVNLCYRFMIPAAELAADARTRRWAAAQTARATIYVDGARRRRRRLIGYTCRDNTLFNFAGLVHDEGVAEGQARKSEVWYGIASVDEAIDRFGGFHPDIISVMRKAKEVRRWPLLYRPPLRTWRREMLVLIGDAAHPMLPHQGQGGAQGVEDGLTLGIVLHGASADDRADIVKRLQVFEDVRRTRASVIQVLSSTGQDEVGRLKEEAMPYLAEEKIPTNAGEVARFNFGHDAVEAACEAMRGHDAGFMLPEGFCG